MPKSYNDLLTENAALIKERDALVAANEAWHKRVVNSDDVRDLARENESLLECVKEYARREIEAGESGDGLAQDCLAALANAPTPNDKGK